MKKVHQIIDNQSDLKLKQQQAKRVSQSLIMELQIPMGKHLTYFLQEPKAKDNCDAISRWVLRNQRDKNIGSEHYTELKEQLCRELSDLNTGY